MNTDKLNKIPYNLGETKEKALEDFSSNNPLEMAQKSGCEYDESKQIITLPFLDEVYEVHYPSGEVKNPVTGEAPFMLFEILFLHYLTGASGFSLRKEWISFKELPGGQIYITPFNNRAIKPFLGVFGAKPDEFKKAAEALNAKPDQHGDIAYVLPVFPRLPVMFVLWEGDDEFPANATILFDAVTSSYMHTEDCAMLSGLLTGKLKEKLS